MRNLLVAFSAANLMFIAVWRRLILPSPADRFWMRIPERHDALAAIFNLLLLGAVLWTLLVIGRRVQRLEFLHAFPALVLLVPLSTVFGGNGPLEIFGHHGLWAVYATAFVIAMFVLYRWRGKVAQLLLIFSPFVLFTLTQAAWMAVRPPAVQPAPPAQPTAAERRPGTRVVMIVFDEMEQRLTFEQRPQDVKLPNLDRLRSESWAADKALPPGNGTHVSIPSLLTSRRVIAARPESANELLVRYQGEGEPRRLSAEPHLFRELRDRGLRTALVGWHLPYCRIFGQFLSGCFAQPRRDPAPRKSSVATAMLKQYQSLFYLFERHEHILEYETLLERSTSAVADPEYDFVYLHLPVPHGPPIYDRDTGGLTIWNLGDGWYFDNLVLADHALGELRSSMERAAVWDRTAVVLTSDHVWLMAHKYAGTRDHRVPFLVRLPGEGAGQRYGEEISAIKAPTVVQGIMNGNVRSAEDVVRTVRR